MSTGTAEIIFENFDPTPEQKEYLQELTNDLSNNAPLNSRVRAKLRKIKNTYLGEVQVQTKSSFVKTAVKSKSLYKIIKNIHNIGLNSLRAWNKERLEKRRKRRRKQKTNILDFSVYSNANIDFKN